MSAASRFAAGQAIRGGVPIAVQALRHLRSELPVVVVAGGDDGRYTLVDGYKRVRALIKLRWDTVRATCWASRT